MAKTPSRKRLTFKQVWNQTHAFSSHLPTLALLFVTMAQNALSLTKGACHRPDL